MSATHDELTGDDVEYFCLRVPAHLDVSEILNGVTINLPTKFLTSSSSAVYRNECISRFKDNVNDQEYSLTLADQNESVAIRLLVPDTEDQDKLLPSSIKGQLNLTSVVSTIGENMGDGSSNIQTDLLLAPAEDRAPKPALDQSGNGAVDKIRLAYVPVPQREGLKQRWAMPGSSGTSQVSENKHRKIKEEVIVSGDEEPHRSRKKAKKSSKA
ncbi:hypothetical protein HJC23_004225 [Cyclotella cryptica]|uniref:Uncharacterized protein n=1 Tax=Cyclotella cryptica TaxID=29204 RepID=A0ABD3Q822_9STRA|eukprot:CCRYP_007870-RA/>CCRYP_007870-RA protein AED:0.10 eAED:-0.07 QI:0/-1/0/1/-1/1/1/0/212